jgi:hypothetical protein
METKRRLQNEEAVFRNITIGVDVFISLANYGTGKCKHRFFDTDAASRPIS